jgi:hypothetical protein
MKLLEARERIDWKKDVVAGLGIGLIDSGRGNE